MAPVFHRPPAGLFSFLGRNGPPPTKLNDDASGHGQKGDIDNTFGGAAQAGADFKIADHLYFNLDYKYINAESKLQINGGQKFKLDLNPHLIAMGLGYRF